MSTESVTKREAGDVDVSSSVVEHLLEIDPNLSIATRDALLGRLMYSLGKIDDCRYDDARSVIVVAARNDRAPMIEQTFQRIYQEVRNTHYLRKRTIHEDFSCDCDLKAQAVFENRIPPRLFERIHKGIRNALDELCSKHTDQFLRFPSMIQMETLTRCQYMRTFPQNAFVVDQFPHDYVALNEIKTETDLRKLQEPSGFALSPASCFHFYGQIADTQVLSEGAVLMASRCFRHEANWRKGPHRLNEFDMLELVFLGTEGYVQEGRQKMMAEVWDLSRRLGLPGVIETAQDPFYLPDDAKKAQYQMMSETKFELIFSSPNLGTSFSIASFNNVYESLCRQFNITNSSGEHHHSGCVAFGLDRWIVALWQMYGSELDRWPSRVSNILGL